MQISPTSKRLCLTRPSAGNLPLAIFAFLRASTEHQNKHTMLHEKKAWGFYPSENTRFCRDKLDIFL